MKVISASRRTDIPAFYADWFMNRIRAGSCQWVNPFNGKLHEVSLNPADCLALIFWTRNPAPMLPHLAELRDRGFRCAFHVTINGYPKPLEERTPNVDSAITQFRKLADAISPEFVMWRYDPLIITTATPTAWHLERFAYVSSRLRGFTRRCTFSFVSWYGKTKRNFQYLQDQHDLVFMNPSLKTKDEILSGLVPLARMAKIGLYTCCDDTLVRDGIAKAHCIDLDIVRALRPDLKVSLAVKPTRKECGCYESVDIGAYDSCTFGCRYCYATNNPDLARRNQARHHPDQPALLMPVKAP